MKILETANLLQYEKYDSHLVVIAKQNIDLTNSLAFYLEARRHLSTNYKQVVIDLSRSKRQDDSTLAALLLIASDLKRMWKYSFVGVVGMDISFKRHFEKHKCGITYLTSVSAANKFLRRNSS